MATWPSAWFKRAAPLRISLALQGGGAHGAFTWGVLDRLLQEPDLDLDGISGTSAGALNAAALASGWCRGGPLGAREALSALWEAVADHHPEAWSALPKGALPGGAPWQGSSSDGDPPWPMALWVELSRYFSPQELNPFDINPLRAILTEQIDFEALRSRSPIKLFVAATQVRSGKLKLFENAELSVDSLLASTCLPTVHHTITVANRRYWDGGYAANPAIFPLLYRCQCRDIFTILLQPLRREREPTTAQEIWHRVTELSFNATFLREMRAIAEVRHRLQGRRLLVGPVERRLLKARFHLLEGDQVMQQYSAASKLNNQRAFLRQLRDQGRDYTERWLTQHRADLGVRSSIDLHQLFA